MCCASVFAACSRTGDSHIHTWSSTYTQDGDRHYQICSGCDEKNYNSHNYDNGFCVCGKEEPDRHEHTYSLEWTYNETHHWHKATCEHDNEIKDKETHDFGNGACVCGKRQPTVGLEYTLNEDEESYSVTGLGTAQDAEIVIASEYEEKPVTCIGEQAFYNCTLITSVWIPEGVKIIYWYAFYLCTSLENITIPNTVTDILEGTFSGCKSLKNVVIPNSVKGIGKSAFEQCHSLERITIPDSVASIGAWAFAGCRQLTSIKLPNGITCIEARLFDDCTLLSDIEIPEEITSIGAFAFANTAWFSNLPSGLVYVGDVAYVYKGGMPEDFSIALREGTVGIAGRAFYNRTTLTNITMPNTLKNIGDDAFSGCSTLANVTIPASVTEIGEGAFAFCHAFTDIRIPDKVTDIQDSLFEGCRNLVKVTLPDTVVSIGEEAFKNCKYLTDITLPSSLVSIGSGAFYGCESIREIEIPANVERVGNSAFVNCVVLTDIDILGTITEIGAQAFANTPWYTSHPWGVVYICDIACGYRGPMSESLEIKEGTKGIAGNTFSSYADLKSVTIPSSVTHIGKDAFFHCYSLASITFGGTKEQWDDIAKHKDWDTGTVGYTIHCIDGDIVKS